VTHKINKLILITILTSLTSLFGFFGFSAMAASHNGGLKKESTAKSVKVNLSTSKSTKIERKISQDSELGEVSVSRRQVVKKTRTDTNKFSKSISQQSRSKQPQKSSRSDDFEIFDSWISLDSDFDGDGFYSEFSLNFDADTIYSSADVYAEIYISLAGGSWELFYVSEDFTIFSNSETDFYSVSFGLNFDYPTGDYDILIDLFEVGYSGVVTTAGPSEDGDLYRLPLEDNEHELDSNNTLITYVASELFADLDRDGFYTQLTLEYDIETYDSGRTVYAQVDIIDAVTMAQRTVETQNFLLGNQTEFIDIDFSSGYSTSYYDFEIRLIDVYTGEVIAVAAQDFSSLTQLPVESEEYDYSDIDAHVRGGGSLGLSLILLGGILFFTKRR
jgi:hypothetical protein